MVKYVVVKLTAMEQQGTCVFVLSNRFSFRLKFPMQNTSFSGCFITACAFAAAEMCLPNRYQAMDVSFGCTVPTFGRHVTVFKIKTESYAFMQNMVGLTLRACTLTGRGHAVA
jgi:hypothetical protein